MSWRRAGLAVLLGVSVVVGVGLLIRALAPSPAGPSDEVTAQSEGVRPDVAASPEPPATKLALRRPAVGDTDQAPRLRGRVVDAGGGAPIDQARVLVESAHATLHEERTRADGMFAADALQTPGTSLYIDRDGYFPCSLSHEDWWEQVAQAGDAIPSVELAPLGSLRVRVLDENGAPIESAYVRVDLLDPHSGTPLAPPPGWKRFQMPGHYTEESLHSPDVVQAGTDANGELTIVGLPCGRPLLLRASLAVVPVQQAVTLDPAIRHADLVLRVASSGMVHGIVRWSDGTPAAGLALRIRPSSLLADLRETAADGSYDFRGLRPASYVIEVLGRPASAVTVEVRAGIASVADIVLERPSVVAGRLVRSATNGDGVPAPVSGDGLILSVFQHGSLLSHERVGMDGSFKFEAEAGPLQILPRCQEEPAWSRWLPVHAVAPDPALEIALRGGLGGIRLEPDGFQAGEARALVFLGGNPPAGRAVRLAFDQEERILRRPLRPAGQGQLGIENLPPGRHDLLIEVVGAGAAWLPGIELLDGNPAMLGRVTPGFGSVRGGVASFMPGTASPALLAVLTGPTGKPRTTVVGEAGRFEFPGVAEGPYMAAVSAWAGTPEAASFIEVKAGATVELEGLAPPPAGEVRCTVRRDGQPVAGARLRIHSLEDRRERWQLAVRSPVETDAEGVAVFHRVHAGALEVSLLPTDSEPGSWRSARVELDEGGSADVGFELPAERVATGFLSSRERLRDVQGVHVILRDGSRTYAVAESDGWVLLEPRPEPVLLAIERLQPAGAHAAPGRRLHHVVETSLAGETEPRWIELPASALTIRTPSAGRLEPPLAELLDVDGHVVAPGGAPVSLWLTAAGADRFLLPHLPVGARLRLHVRGLDGQVVTHALRFDGREGDELVLR